MTLRYVRSFVRSFGALSSHHRPASGIPRDRLCCCSCFRDEVWRDQYPAVRSFVRFFGCLFGWLVVALCKVALVCPLYVDRVADRIWNPAQILTFALAISSDVRSFVPSFVELCNGRIWNAASYVLLQLTRQFVVGRTSMTGSQLVRSFVRALHFAYLTMLSM